MPHAANNNDRAWMRRALRLARRAWGRTSPNPLVGAVVVRNGCCVGEGYHHRAGTPHAEVHALAAAGRKARGATVYVTLEPCSTFGRTPPCTDALLRAGVGRVVVGCLDPNPKHAGKGVEILRSHGIKVVTGGEERACCLLNEAFFHWIIHNRPFVLLKMAMTLDGRIATASGQSQWITGEKARRQVQALRRWADAILVGGETVRLDDSALTVRTPQNWWRQPRKFVWTRRAADAFPRELRIFADSANPPEFVHPQSSTEWGTLLDDLGRRQITSLLIEGGGELAGACLQAGVVDKVQFYIAPKLLGGRNSRPVVGGADVASLAVAQALRHVAVKRIGEDILVTGYTHDVYGLD